MSNLQFAILHIFVTVIIIGFVDFAAFIQFKYIINIEVTAMTFIMPTMLGVIFGILFSLIHHYYEKQKSMQMYKDIAMTDVLTGVTSRYACDLILDIEHKRYLRNKTPFSIVMIDIDDFKNVNDTYGHDVGDETLCTLTKCLESDLRAMDTVCRWGGEEFIVVLPETDIDTACEIAENLRKNIYLHNFNHVRSVSISVGVSSINDKSKNLKEIIKNSDDALYEAKKSGKNRVICK